MFKSKRNLIFIIVSLLLVTCAIIVTTPIFNTKASQEGTSISYQTPQNPTFSVQAYKTTNNSTNRTTVYNNEYVLLEKDDSFNLDYHKICFDIESDSRTSKYIVELKINAYLNGDAIDVNVKSKLNQALQGANLESYLNFEISRNTNITYQNILDEEGNKVSVEDLQGHYEFYFSVSLYDTTTRATTNEPTNVSWYKYEFTVIDEEQYTKANQAPALQNVTNEDGIFTNDYVYENQTKYAQVKFDAERFKLIISRVFEGKSEQIQTSFTYFTDNTYTTSTTTKTNYAKLYFTYPNKVVSFNMEKKNNLFIFDESLYSYNSSNTENYTLPIFYELGEYSIKPYYQIYQNGDILYDASANSPVGIDAINLVVYGFNLNYAYNLTDTKYFISFKQNEIITTDFSNFQTSTIADISIPSTNQAPVWFNTQAGVIDSIVYYHALTKAQFFNNATTVQEILADSKSSNNWQTVNKNFYFTESGYYAVVCSYKYNSVSSATPSHKVFLFQIKANTPSISLKIDGTDENLVSGGYTNSNVYIEMTKEGEFDSIVTAQYALNTNYSSTFTNYTSFTTKKEAGDSYTIFSEQGKYSIKVMFGKQSTSYYTFTIDKTDVKNYVNAYSLKKQNISRYITDVKVTDKTILNSNFTVIIQEKPSKAKITAKLITVDIQSYVPNQTEYYTTNDYDEYINARYQATYASSPNDYNNIVSNISSYIDNRYVFKEHKIYIFEVSDEAGFSYIHIVYLDKANANMLQYDSTNALIETNEYNIVSSKTKLVWSKNKAIEFIDRNTLKADNAAYERNTYAMSLLANNENFKYNATTFVLLVPIKEINITSTNLNGTTQPNISGNLYSAYKYSKEFTVYGTQDEAKNYDVPQTQIAMLTGEKIYTVKIVDQSGIETVYNIEVNMDKSLGKAFTTNDATENSYSSNMLNLEKAGSLDYLVFEWKDDDSESAFAISSLTYDFYPLTYNEKDTFPYASTPTKSESLLIDKKSNSKTGLNYSNPINTTHIKYYEYNSSNMLEQKQKIATEAGKYVITRTYVGSGNSEDITSTGDRLVRTYIYYVDRNPIIDYPQSDLIPENQQNFTLGGGIKLLFGQEEKEFNEFYREPIKSTDLTYQDDNVQSTTYYTLESNLLPIKIKVPQNKYSLTDGSNALTYASTPSTFKLVATLQKFDKSGNFEWEKTYSDSADEQGYLNIPTITSDKTYGEGFYVIRIKDNSVIANTQLTPNLTSSEYFAFYVNLSGPQASIISSNTETTIASQEPLSMIISGNQFIYFPDREIVDHVSTKYRALEKNNPNLNTPFETPTNNVYDFSGSITQKAFDIVDGTKLLQYEFTITYKDGSTTIRKSPLYFDYNNFTTLTNGSATKDNYIVLKFEEPNEDYLASIDYNDLKIVRYEKANGVYGKPTTLSYGSDFVLQQRYNHTTGKLIYSVVVFAIDADNPSKEYKFDVTYHFIGDEKDFQKTSGSKTESFYSDTKTVYLDKTAPTYNIGLLANNAVNTKNLSLNNMKAYTSSFYKDSNNTYYYANVSNFDFAIDSNFSFTRPINAQGSYDKQEGNQIYYRKYYKYDESAYAETSNKNQAYQSIVPGDPEYVSGTSARLRFNAQNPLWTQISYDTNKSFINQVRDNIFPRPSSLSELYGYYEIIEIDEVGNHTIYTVLFNGGNPSFTFNYNTKNASDVEITRPAVENNTIKTDVSSYNYISLNTINNLDKWYTISVDNYLTINVNPYSNMDSVLKEINSALNRNKHNYTLTITNRFSSENTTVQIYINFSIESFNVTASTRPNDDGKYLVTFESDKDGLIMKSARVEKFNPSTKAFELMLNSNGLPVDSLDNVIVVDAEIEGFSRVYTFDEGIYKFYIEDNFNFGDNATVVTLNVGNSSADYKLIYSSSEKTYQGKIYTTDNVTLKASQDRYTVNATRNGTNIDVNSDEFIFEAPSSSVEANIVSGGEYRYVVTILDNVTGEEIVKEFIIYNIFPAVNAKNSKGENMNKLLATDKANVSSFTSDSVYLTYSSSGYTFGYSFVLRRYDNLNATNYISSVNASSSGITVYAKGAYELIIKNNVLGSERYVYFVIRESSISMYSVSEKLPDETLNELSPAQTLLDISGYKATITNYLASKGKTYNFGSNLYVKNYFSIYDFEVTVDGDKGLNTNWGKQSEEILYTHINVGTTNKTYIVIVYGLSPYNYLDVFALTKVASNNRFLQTLTYSYDEEVINEETGEKTTSNVKVDVPTTSFDNVYVYANPVTISWQSYFDVTQNKVYMTYSFNGKEIGTVEPSTSNITTISFTDDGVYKLQFKDLAGNKMFFGDGLYSEFTFTIKSQVYTLINKKETIYGAVYNDAVNFEIYEPNTYTQLSVDVYINGVLQKNSKLNKSNPSITFNQTGFYKIIINGSMRTSTSTVKALETKEVVFTIINPNESKFAYEFASISGYQITKVLRNGFDITDEISSNNAGIYSLVLSEDINGVGKYTITVHADFINSLRTPEEFTFDVWVNNKTPSLDVNTKRNEISVSPIVITYNAKALYEQLGACKIVIGSQEFEINANNAVDDKNRTLTIGTAGTYYITLVTESGNVISIYKVTKQDPLNVLSIILIILGSGVLIAGIYLFYRLRVRMKIK